MEIKRIKQETKDKIEEIKERKSQKSDFFRGGNQ